MKQFIFLCLFVIFNFLAAVKSSAVLPGWASKQLQLRQLLDQCITETQQWQRNDGGIFDYLNQYKWDDEVEIFYGWTIYYLFTGDEAIYQSVKGAAFKYLERAGGSFVHGYYPNPFFDTEHTLEGLNMLGALAFVKPEDQEVIAALEDLVEHVGNWVPGYAAWFDPNTKHIKSLRPGTTRVDEGRNSSIDWVFNLGFAKLALAAYHATENPRYLNWVRDYLDGWIASMERNERENGYYVLPAEVNPLTGELGSYSGAWWFAAFEPGWGWLEKGNNANRDMRGAFMDYYRISKEERYLEAFKKHLWTLFNNGTGNIPAHTFDGVSWSAYSDKVTARMSVEASLLSPYPDSSFDRYLENWNYRQQDYWMWDFRRNNNWSSLNTILDKAIKNANLTLESLRSLLSLPLQPDYFPQILEFAGISLSAFGGVLANRGEMPWTEALYYKQDGSLGLEPGVAAVVAKGNDSVKVVYLCNSNTRDKIVQLQANFRPSNLAAVYVDDVFQPDFSLTRARVNVPAGETIKVELVTFGKDTIPPLPPVNLQIVSVNERSISFAWGTPNRAADGDLPRLYRIYRESAEVGQQDSLTFFQRGLQEQTSYRYTVRSEDKSGNLSKAATLDITTSADHVAPVVTNITVINQSMIQIRFSEALDPVSATLQSNYSISPSISVQSADLPDKNRVLLTTSAHNENITYFLQVSDVKDASKTGNPIAMAIPIAYIYSPQLQVRNISRAGYYVRRTVVGDSLFNDRSYTVTEIPSALDGFQWIVTSNDDKTSIGNSFLSFSINRPAAVYVGFDQRLVASNLIPGWLTGWEKTNYKILSDDTEFVCFRQEFTDTSVTLGGNGGGNSSSMYLILLDPSIDIIAPNPPTGLKIS